MLSSRRRFCKGRISGGVKLLSIKFCRAERRAQPSVPYVPPVEGMEPPFPKILSCDLSSTTLVRMFPPPNRSRGSAGGNGITGGGLGRVGLRFWPEPIWSAQYQQHFIFSPHRQQRPTYPQPSHLPFLQVAHLPFYQVAHLLSSCLVRDRLYGQATMDLGPLRSQAHIGCDRFSQIRSSSEFEIRNRRHVDEVLSSETRRCRGDVEA